MKIVKDKEAVVWYTSNGIPYYGFRLFRKEHKYGAGVKSLNTKEILGGIL